MRDQFMETLYESESLALLIWALKEAFSTEAELGVLSEDALGVALMSIVATGETRDASVRRIVEEAERRGRLDSLIDVAVGMEQTVVLEAIGIACQLGRLGELTAAFVEGESALRQAARATIALRPGPVGPLSPHRGEWEEQLKQCDRDREAMTFASEMDRTKGDAPIVLLTAQDGAMQRHFVGRLVSREFRKSGKIAASPTEWHLPPTGLNVHDAAAVTGFLEASFQKALAEAESAYRRFLREERRDTDASAPLLALRATLDEAEFRRNPRLTRHLLSEFARLVTTWTPKTAARLQVFLLLCHDDAGADPADRWRARLRRKLSGGRKARTFHREVAETLTRASCPIMTPCPELGPGERSAVSGWAESHAALLGGTKETVLEDAIRASVFAGYSSRRMTHVVTQLFELRRRHRMRQRAERSP